MRPLALAVCALLLPACSTAGLSEMIEALGKDPATVCAKIVYGPAVAQVYRTNALNAKVRCNNDGLDVEAVTLPK